jgi:hypothetical protein
MYAKSQKVFIFHILTQFLILIIINHMNINDMN